MSIPFTPQTNTVALVIGTIASSVALPAASGSTPGGMIQCMITVVGSQVGWFSKSTAVIPVAGTPSDAFPVNPGAQVIVTLPAGATISAIASASGSTAYFTQGIGS